MNRREPKQRLSPWRVRSQPGAASGFTLIELLVVTALIAILAGILCPMILRARAKARMVRCAANLHSIGKAYTTSLIESSGYLLDAFYLFDPSEDSPLVTLRNAVETDPCAIADLGSVAVLLCPSDNQPVGILGRSDTGESVTALTSYAYNVALPLLFANASRVDNPSGVVTFYDGDAASLAGTWLHYLGWAEHTVRKRHIGQANYLYLDGHVETLPAFPAIAFEAGGQLLAPPYWIGSMIAGRINVNPGNSPNDRIEFYMNTGAGQELYQNDLVADEPLSGEGFHPDHLEYAGPATVLRVKPKALGLMKDLVLLVDGRPFTLPINRRSTISSDSMTVHLYNDRRNRHGKAVGKWWVQINAQEATITTED